MTKDYEVGNFYSVDGTVYVYINKSGTVRKYEKIRWYKILFLFLLQAIGKCQQVADIEKFLMG